MTVSAQTAGSPAIDLAGRRVLITGGTKGIGAAIAPMRHMREPMS